MKSGVSVVVRRDVVLRARKDTNVLADGRPAID